MNCVFICTLKYTISWIEIYYVQSLTKSTLEKSQFQYENANYSF